MKKYYDKFGNEIKNNDLLFVNSENQCKIYLFMTKRTHGHDNDKRISLFHEFDNKWIKNIGFCYDGVENFKEKDGCFVDVMIIYNLNEIKNNTEIFLNQYCRPDVLKEIFGKSERQKKYFDKDGNELHDGDIVVGKYTRNKLTIYTIEEITFEEKFYSQVVQIENHESGATIDASKKELSSFYTNGDNRLLEFKKIDTNSIGDFKSIKEMWEGKEYIKYFDKDGTEIGESDKVIHNNGSQYFISEIKNINCNLCIKYIAMVSFEHIIKLKCVPTDMLHSLHTLNKNDNKIHSIKKIPNDIVVENFIQAENVWNGKYDNFIKDSEKYFYFEKFLASFYDENITKQKVVDEWDKIIDFIAKNTFNESENEVICEFLLSQNVSIDVYEKFLKNDVFILYILLFHHRKGLKVERIIRLLEGKNEKIIMDFMKITGRDKFYIYISNPQNMISFFEFFGSDHEGMLKRLVTSSHPDRNECLYKYGCFWGMKEEIAEIIVPHFIAKKWKNQ